jgi:hypothetical protein
MPCVIERCPRELRVVFSDDDDSSYMDRLKQLNSLLVQQGVDQNVTLGFISRKLNWVIEHPA